MDNCCMHLKVKLVMNCFLKEILGLEETTNQFGGILISPSCWKEESYDAKIYIQIQKYNPINKAIIIYRKLVQYWIIK